MLPPYPRQQSQTIDRSVGSQRSPELVGSITEGKSRRFVLVPEDLLRLELPQCSQPQLGRLILFRETSLHPWLQLPNNQLLVPGCEFLPPSPDNQGVMASAIELVSVQGEWWNEPIDSKSSWCDG